MKHRSDSITTVIPPIIKIGLSVIVHHKRIVSKEVYQNTMQQFKMVNSPYYTVRRIFKQLLLKTIEFKNNDKQKPFANTQRDSPA
jgi:hypothetical protein